MACNVPIRGGLGSEFFPSRRSEVRNKKPTTYRKTSQEVLTFVSGWHIYL